MYKSVGNEINEDGTLRIKEDGLQVTANFNIHKTKEGNFMQKLNSIHIGMSDQRMETFKRYMPADLHAEFIGEWDKI